MVEEGKKIEDTPDGGPKAKGSSSVVRIIRRILLVFVILLICCITACQVHYYKARKTPAVSGRVVDIETGVPIAGADVLVAIYGFPSNPIAAIASPPRWTLTRAYLKTDNKGEFFFPSEIPPLKNAGNSWWSYAVFGPDRQIGIGVYVFPKDHVTVASRNEGFDWNEDPLYLLGPKDEKGKPLINVLRRHNNQSAFEYTLKTKKAESEKEWEAKCASTLLHYQDVAHWESLDEPGKTCLFNDLVGYLERYPQGEKAGNYMEEIRYVVAPLGVSYLDEHDYSIDKRKVTKKDIELWINRKEQFLALYEKISAPLDKKKNPLTYDNWPKEIEKIKGQVHKLKEKVDSGLPIS
jgi:hypothetical protein